MTAHVARDPFARTALHRETDRDARGRSRPCYWCGGPYAEPVLGHSARTYRRTYTYTTEPDDRGCPRPAGRTFCNLSCLRAYYG